MTLTRTTRTQPTTSFKQEMDMSPSQIRASKRPKYSSKPHDDVDMPDADVDMTTIPGYPSSHTNFTGYLTPSTNMTQERDDINQGLSRRESVQTFDTEALQSFRSNAPSAPSTTTDGFHILGDKLKHLIKAQNDIRKEGVTHVIDTTELVLTGDQSAGKSSLMGALTDIQLPKSGGTCTRCPSHIMTSPAPQWSCKVSLEESFAFEPPNRGRPIQLKVTAKQPFPPWVDKHRKSVKNFVTIYDKEQLLNAMKWAQIAILNPTRDYQRYVPGSPQFCDDATCEAEFSPNVVSVEIQGPELPSLSFYDLPGVVNAMGDPSKSYQVDMIKELVLQYLKRPKTLIICALAMSLEPHASATFKIISDNKEFSTRSVGILTKPDLLTTPNRDTWHKVLENKEFKLGHGHYVTKQPEVHKDTKFGKDFYSQARDAEVEFFTTKDPWNDSWSFTDEKRGITRIREFLAQHLANAFIEDLPEFLVKIDARANEIEEELKTLPELPSINQLMRVSMELRGFGSNVQQCIQGGRGFTNFQREWRKICEEFRDVVMQMRPGINISTAISPAGKAHEVINLDEDDTSSAPTSPIAVRNGRMSQAGTPSPHGSAQTAKMETPVRLFGAPPPFPQLGNRTGRAPNGTPSTISTPRHIFQTRKRLLEGTGDDYAHCRYAGKNMWSLVQIRDFIASNMPTGVSHLVNPVVHQELCMKSIARWNEPIVIFLDKTIELFQEMIFDCFDTKLSCWKQTLLFSKSKEILESYLKNLEERQAAENDEIFVLETYRWFTLINTVFTQNIKNETQSITDLRNLARVKGDVRLKAHKEYNKIKTKFEDDKEGGDKAYREIYDRIAKEAVNALPADPFNCEIEVAGYVRGYYTTAASRFVEDICRFTQGKLFREVELAIGTLLEERLEIATPDPVGNSERCNFLMQEDNDTAKRRGDLIEERNRLAASKKRLQELTEKLQTNNWAESPSGSPVIRGRA